MAKLSTAHASLDHTGLPGIGGSSSVLVNEFRNFPSMEIADGAQPEWWEEGDANATLTEEDTAGESITETWERCLKVVTTGAGKYAYQRFTYADEPRLKSGRTVSLRVAVWSVSSAAARVRIQSSVGSLGVSSDTTAAAWTILTVNAEVLDGTYVEARFEVDTGTAYFVPLAFGLGSSADNELPPRGVRYRAKQTEIFFDNAVADPNTWTDLDCTAATSPLACIANAYMDVFKGSGTSGFDGSARRNGSSDGGTAAIMCPVTSISGVVRSHQSFVMLLDDGQVFEYNVDRWTGTGTAEVSIGVTGWWEWA